MVGDYRIVCPDFKLDIIEAATRSVFYPVDLFRGGGCQTGVHSVRPQFAGSIIKVQADDIGFLAGKFQNFFAATSYH